MASAKKLWEREYRDKNLPSSFLERPSRALAKFTSFFEKNRIPTKGKLLDVGCGRGRNGIALAKLGFQVYGVDVASNAISDYKKKIAKEHLGERIKVYNLSLAKPLPFADSFFDVVFDFTTLFRVTGKRTLQMYVMEAYRVLKNGGYMVQSQLNPKDQYYSSRSVGANGIFIDKNGTTGKLYTTGQLIDLFSFGFKPVFRKTIFYKNKSRDIIYGHSYERTHSFVIFKKE